MLGIALQHLPSFVGRELAEAFVFYAQIAVVTSVPQDADDNPMVNIAVGDGANIAPILVADGALLLPQLRRVGDVFDVGVLDRTRQLAHDGVDR